MKQRKKKVLPKRIRKDLDSLEKYVEEFSAFLPLPVCTLNPSCIIIDINQAARDLTGYKETEVISQGIEFLFKGEKPAEKFFRQVLKQGLVKNQEMVLVARDGKEIPVNVSAAVRKDYQGNVIGYFLAISDITEIKNFQENLEEIVRERTKELEKAKKALLNILEDTEEARRRIEEEKNKTRATLFSLTDGLIVFDKEERITLVNPQAEKILKLKEEQVLDKKIAEVSGFPNLSQLYQALNKEIKWTGRKYELILKKPFARFFQVSITPAVIEKETVGLIVILHDVTREKEINRLKTEFVSIAAHQLRTPLSSVKWTLRMILDGDIGKLSQEQARFLEKGYQSNERMISLINDLLNVARIEEGRFLYRLSWQSLEKIIKKTITALDELIKAKKLKIVFKKPKKSLPQVKVDAEKIELVVQNLLDNAIRYSPAGKKVTISIKRDKMYIEAMIKDMGIGIPHSQRKRIFTKFFRADNVAKLETSGSGLGLFICKNVIEAHGGKIWFESNEGQGTTFWFTLPISHKT